VLNGKIMLVAQAFHVGKRFKDMPLIYSTIVKSALFYNHARDLQGD